MVSSWNTRARPCAPGAGQSLERALSSYHDLGQRQRVARVGAFSKRGLSFGHKPTTDRAVTSCGTAVSAVGFGSVGATRGVAQGRGDASPLHGRVARATYEALRCWGLAETMRSVERGQGKPHHVRATGD
jgi:hypothetical protein